MLHFKAQDTTVTVYGIDLGTTNSTLCCVRLPAGETNVPEPEVVEIPQPTPMGEKISELLPSMVALHQGREYIGQGAKDARALMADPKVKLDKNIRLFYECKNEIGTSRTYQNAPAGYRSPTEIAGKILAYMRREGITGSAPDRVVVTVPASFQTAQRTETARACSLAGLDVSGGCLLDEPVAAFIDYAYRYDLDLLNNIRRKKRLLVFDYGGGTCDIALFDLEKPSPKAPVQVASRSVSRYHRLGRVHKTASVA